MEIIFWTIAGFVSGSIPYSVILARLGRGVDVRQVGDHNPGASNVFRSAGIAWGMLAALLDFFKAFLPVALAWFSFGLREWQIVPVALAPIAGHAFSPWLGGRGGKAVATTFGTWAGLTLFIGPTSFGLLLGLALGIFASSTWSVIVGMFILGSLLWFLFGSPNPFLQSIFSQPSTDWFRFLFQQAHPEFMAVWLGNLLILIYKHRLELKQLPSLRPYLARLIGKSS